MYTHKVLASHIGSMMDATILAICPQCRLR